MWHQAAWDVFWKHRQHVTSLVRAAHITDEEAGELKPLLPPPVRVSVQDCKMCANLQRAMEDLIAVFHRYSGKEGDKYKLNNKELKNLLQEELSDFLAGSNESSVVEKILHDLDENGDGEVDFQEFVVLVAALTIACNEFFVDFDRNSKKGKEDCS
uniref:S100 calcium binding protein A1 n=1 Tax=Amphiprion percula TaxID=161767 RepID=A0A3P8RRP9_AMPPE